MLTTSASYEINELHFETCRAVVIDIPWNNWTIFNAITASEKTDLTCIICHFWTMFTEILLW